MYHCLYCLCVSILILIIIMTELGKYIDEDGNEILTTQQLRGFYVEDIVDEHYKRIYNGVIGTAAVGKTTIYFTIMCVKSQSNDCNNYDGYQEWLRVKHSEPIPKNIQTEQIQNRVIKKLQTAFPDSNITKGNKNCCDQYRINW